MKTPLSSLLLLSLAFAVSAHAEPRVGDQVSYALTSAAFQGTTTLSLTQFNAAQNHYLQHSELKICLPGVAPQASDNWMPAASFLADAQIADDLAHCAEKGGKLEVVQVPAGKIQACTLADENGCPGTNCVASIAKVPFGLARITYDAAGGIAVKLELQSSKYGK